MLAVNMALNRPASQSSTYTITSNGVVCSAWHAVDGNYDTNVMHGFCSNTVDGGGGPNWLAIDLGYSFRIRNVILTNRGDCCGLPLFYILQFYFISYAVHVYIKS